MNGASLERTTWPEVDKRSGDGPLTLLVPIGATEQHGPHLPFGTDSHLAGVLARMAATRDRGTVVAPTLAYGASGEHQDFPGTLSIGAEAIELVLVELGRSANETFERILFVNAHGGNAPPLASAVAKLREEGREASAWSPSWGGDAHAGRIETSLMLALLPEQVRREHASAGTAEPLAEVIGRLQTEGVRAVSPNGVLGDPGGASATEGHALLTAAVDDLCNTLATWAPGPSEVGAP